MWGLFYILFIIHFGNILISFPCNLYRRIRETPDLLICQDYQKLSRRGVEIFISQLQRILNEKGKAVILIPTGGTYLNSGGFYEILIKEYKDKVDWNKVIFMNLDEYIGISPADSRSYNYRLTRVLQALGVREENIFLFDGSKDPRQQCEEREKLIQELGGIDIALLGIGRNGHIAFNEPGSSRDSLTRVVELTPATREQNGPYWGGEDRVPTYAITVGIKTILSARSVILLASGESKAKVIKELFKGENPQIPASYLLTHRDLIIILDKEAAKYLKP
jgi:glucosamine-6-phosphate deaminase